MIEIYGDFGRLEEAQKLFREIFYFKNILDKTMCDVLGSHNPPMKPLHRAVKKTLGVHVASHQQSSDLLGDYI
jgi:hypothetical protein